MELLRCGLSRASGAKCLLRARHRMKIMMLMAAATLIFVLNEWIYLTGTGTVIQWQLRCNQSNQSSHAPKMRTTPAGIPMLLHLVFSDVNMLEAYRINIESCIRLNSNWTVILWTDDSVKLLLAREFPNLQSIFYRFPQKIQRADAIRYVVLYRFGGVYMDLDMHCQRPLLSSLSNIPCFLDKERQFQSNHGHNRTFNAMNSAMGCRPRHPFFKLLIDNVFNAELPNSKLPFPMVIFETTGPFMLTRLYEKWKASNSTSPMTLLGETYFSPKLDPSIHIQCRDVMSKVGERRTNLTHLEASCLKLSQLGYEKSDSKFFTNLTVAVHQFTHLGYWSQKTGKFDILKDFSGVLIYDTEEAKNSTDWPLGCKMLPQP